MAASISYEWDYETVIDEEVEDHCHANRLSEFHETQKTDTLVLVRDLEWENNRSWAYVKDGKLPEYFLDAYGRKEAKVPKRFHKELSKHLK